MSYDDSAACFASLQDAGAPLSLPDGTIGLGRRKVKSLDLRTMTDVSTTERADGSGVITFGPQIIDPFMGRGFGPFVGNNSAGPSFDQIDQAKSVYELIRTAQRRTS
jgi:hypothetical protein